MRTTAGLAIGMALLVIASVIAIVAIRTVGWAREETTDVVLGIVVTRSFGLFVLCVKVRGQELCNFYTEVHDKHQAARGLACSGAICIIIATLLILLVMVLHFKNRSSPISKVPLVCGIGFACFGAVMNFAANGIWGEYIADVRPDAKLFYSFYIFIIASILAVVGSIVAYIGRPHPVQPGTVIMTTTTNTGTVIQQPYPGYAMNNQAYPPQPYGYGPPPSFNQPSPYGAPVQAATNPNQGDPAYPPTAYQGQAPAGNPPEPFNYQPPPQYVQQTGK